jgi:hypothetical protein
MHYSKAGTVLVPSERALEPVPCHLEVTWWIASSYHTNWDAIQAEHCIRYNSTWRSVSSVQSLTPNTNADKGNTTGLNWHPGVEFPVVIINSSNNGRPYVLLYDKQHTEWISREIPRECWESFARYMISIDAGSNSQGYTMTLLRDWNRRTDQYETLSWIARNLDVPLAQLFVRPRAIHYNRTIGTRTEARNYLRVIIEHRKNPLKRKFELVWFSCTRTHMPCLYVQYQSPRPNKVVAMDRSQAEHWKALAWYVDTLTSRFMAYNEHRPYRLLLSWMRPILIQVGAEEDEKELDVVPAWDLSNIQSRVETWISMKFQVTVDHRECHNTVHYVPSVHSSEDAEIMVTQISKDNNFANAYQILLFDCTETQTPWVCMYRTETRVVKEVEVDRINQRHWDGFAMYMENITSNHERGHAHNLLRSWQDGPEIAEIARLQLLSL